MNCPYCGQSARMRQLLFFKGGNFTCGGCHKTSYVPKDTYMWTAAIAATSSSILITAFTHSMSAWILVPSIILCAIFSCWVVKQMCELLPEQGG